MTPALIFPMAAMVAVTSIVLIYMFVVRVGAVRSRQVKLSYFKTYTETPTNDAVLKTNRHFINLFETPVLFYAACIAGMALPIHSASFVTVAWLYVAARAVHAFVHLGANNLRVRMTVYFVSWIFLWTLWIQLVLAVIPY